MELKLKNSQMKEKTKHLPVIICGCIADKEKKTIDVIFQTEETVRAAVMQSLTFKIQEPEEACNFFKNFPVFTKEGHLDYNGLEGSRAYLNLIERGSGWEIVSADYDYSFYGINMEEEQADFEEVRYER